MRSEGAVEFEIQNLSSRNGLLVERLKAVFHYSNMILSDAAIQILYNTKSNKSKKRDQNKINEYVEALAGIPDHNLGAEDINIPVVQTHHRPKYLKAENAEQAAAESGVDSNLLKAGSRKRLLLVSACALYLTRSRPFNVDATEFLDDVVAPSTRTTRQRGRRRRLNRLPVAG
jgi:hypothetical protein